MTEIPDHLLERTRARRRALGLPVAGDDGGGAGGDAGPAPGGAPAPSAPAPMKSPVPIPAGDAAPDAPVVDSPQVAAHKARKKVPVWAMPVVAALPIWAFIYAGTVQEPGAPAIGPLEVGATLYDVNCAACHGGGGEGGAGYALDHGEVIATFPNATEQVLHVARGSSPIAGEPYGDPDRAGGQRVAGDLGAMPGFASSLTDIEIELIVWYERITLAGEELEPAQLATVLEDLQHRMETVGQEVDIEDLAEKVANGENPVLEGHA
ncbi:MAG: c-type cytochrome [Actinomycetia bacterium]|nr:c-type cytochrome [Actinomycetes bacterium]